MRKRNLTKAAVLLVCFAFLGLSASGLTAAPQKSSKISFGLLLKVPAQILFRLFPGLRNIVKIEQPPQLQPGNSSSLKSIKTMAEISILRPSGKD
jgi:hypothetical protein